MSKECCAPGGDVMILPCSGGSNVYQLSNQALVELAQESLGKMFCLAGIGGHLSGFVQSTKDVPNAANVKDVQEAMGYYRGIRDEIKTFVDRLPQALLEKESGPDASQQQLFESEINSFLSRMVEDLLKKSEDQEEDR